MNDQPQVPDSVTERKPRPPQGSPPGTLVPDPNALPPIVQTMSYGPDSFEEREITGLDQLDDLLGKYPVTWVNVDGLADLEMIRELGAKFGLHSLALEDAVNVHQRPKTEEYDDHVFIVTRMGSSGPPVATEQVSMFVGANFLLTFQERPGDSFDLVRDRLRRHRGRIRSAGADYLAYALLDATIDGYFPIMERYGILVDEMEDAVLQAPHPNLVPQLHGLRRDLLNLRRAIWPQRDMVNALIRDSTPIFRDETNVYLRDCYDHTVQLLDLVETYREVTSGLFELYLSSISTKMNEVMKFLTIIATIFIPLGFIAGLYGMNFDPDISPWNMPELRWRWGYPLAIALMAAVGGGLVIFFRKRDWL